MRTRKLRTGLELTEIGFGTSQLGNLYRETSEEEAAAAIETAWAGGVRYFDTAPHYGLGLSERRVGRLLSAYPRDEYVLSTKVGRLIRPNPVPNPGMDDEGFAVPATVRREWDLTRDGIRRSIDESLERLGLDRIDIAYLHDPYDFLDQAVSEALPALIELREEGVLGAVGAGMNDAEPLARFVRATDIDVVMVACKLTLLDQRAREELIPEAQDKGVNIVAAGVYNSGILATERPRPDAKFDYEQADLDLIRKAELMADRCEAAGVSLPAAAIHFPLTEPTVASVVVGVRNGQQARTTFSRYAEDVPEALLQELTSGELR